MSFFSLLFSFIIILSAGCLINQNNEKFNDKFDYVITITTNSENKYTVILPIVINYKDENVSNIMKHIEISYGECDYYIEETINGPGLNITGSGNLSIVSTDVRYEEYGILSLKYDSNGNGQIKDEGPNVKYWYYFTSQKNITINFKINCQIRHGSSWYNSELFLTEVSSNGWNKANGKEEIALP